MSPMEVGQKEVEYETPLVEKKDLDKLVGFREDLRPPAIGVGRCCVTGEIAKCIGLDLGDISIVVPDFDKSVYFDPITEEVSFKEKTIVWANSLAVSEIGLQKLLDFIREAPDVILTISPHLEYQWRVMYRDASAVGQYYKDTDTGEEREILWGSLVEDEIISVSLVPHYPEDIGRLPEYTFVRATGAFLMNGQLLDVRYDGVYPYESDSKEMPPVIYARSNHHTVTSAPSHDAHNFLRTFDLVSSNVLQLLGWAIGGRDGSSSRCIIAVDSEGSWRPWDYVDK